MGISKDDALVWLEMAHVRGSMDEAVIKPAIRRRIEGPKVSRAWVEKKAWELMRWVHDENTDTENQKGYEAQVIAMLTELDIKEG